LLEMNIVRSNIFQFLNHHQVALQLVITRNQTPFAKCARSVIGIALSSANSKYDLLKNISNARVVVVIAVPL